MKKTKRNAVLGILLCAGVFGCLFWGYMWTRQEKGTLEIQDISGDRDALAAFAFDGIAGEDAGSRYFRWENGTWSTAYYPTDTARTAAMVRAAQDGAGFGQYFASANRNTDPLWENVYFAPYGERTVRTDEGELSEAELRDARLELEAMYDISDGSTAALEYAVTSDAVQVMAELEETDSGKSAQFATGLVVTDGAYTMSRWGGPSYSVWLTPDTEGMQLLTAELPEAYYAILSTDGKRSGEVILQRIPKEGLLGPMRVMTDEEAKLSPISEEVFGGAEALCRFAVSEENRVLGLTAVSDERLLLLRAAENRLLLELYDADGVLLDRADAGIEVTAGSELGENMLYRREGQSILSFAWLSAPADQDYLVQSGFVYRITADTIERLPLERSADYVDYADGKLLQMESIWPSSETETDATPLEQLLRHSWYGQRIGYEITVLDCETGAELYRGRLTTDFLQDQIPLLSAVEEGAYLQTDGLHFSYDLAGTWMECRSISDILPADGDIGYLSPQYGAPYGRTNWVY